MILDGNQVMESDNMILWDLKEEDRKFELENNNLESNDGRIYEINLKQVIDYPSKKVNDEKIECFSVRFNKGDKLIGAGFSNGTVVVFDPENEKSNVMKASDYPVTSIRWRPDSEGSKSILVSVTADGKVTQWHASSGKVLYSFVEEDNALMCLDYSSEGNKFATAGNDKLVRLYDDKTKSLITTMTSGNFNQPGHSNRIFAVNFHKQNPNFMASGGWDNTVQFYDVKSGNIINSVYGPHISGDSLDMKGDYMITGSWALKDQIQIWDLRMFKVVTNVKWEQDKAFYPTYIYATAFSKNSNNLFAVGGSNQNTFRIFENETENMIPQFWSKYFIWYFYIFKICFLFSTRSIFIIINNYNS
jgi:WD40 repeat protein